MKCHSRNIYYFIASILIFMLTFFSVNARVMAASEYNMNVSLYKCDPSGYAGKNLTQGSIQCRLDFINGKLNSYYIPSGEIIEPGTKVMVVLNLDIGSGREMTAFQTRLNYDATNFSPILNNGKILSAFARTTDLPTYTDYNEDGEEVKKTNWTSMISTENNSVFITVSDTTLNKMPLTKNINFAYLFFEVSTSAIPGASTYFNFGTRSGENSGTNANGTVLNVNTSDSTYSIAGGKISDDNSLKTLTVTGNSNNYPLGTAENPLTNSFVAGSKTPSEFTVIVPNNVSTIDISATANDADAQALAIAKDGGTSSDRSLSVGENNFSVSVTALNGDTFSYKIKVYRLNNDYKLTGISLSNNINIGTFNSDTLTYTINNVPYATNSTNISVTKSDSKATVTGDGAWSLSNYGSTTNTRKIVVEAENCKSEYSGVTGNSCSKDTYTLNINRLAPSTNYNLSALTVDGVSVPDFSPTKYTYTVDDVANSKTSVNIGATLDDNLATIVSGTGSNTLNVGDNALQVVVRAENNTTKTYTINIRRKNNDVKLKTLNVTSNPSGTLSPAFNATQSFTGPYTYSYDASVKNISISVSTNDTNAKVSLTDVTDGSTPTTGTSNTANKTFTNDTTSVIALVTSENGDEERYTINLTRSQSTNNYLKSLKVDNVSVPDFNRTTRSYNITVESNVTSVNVEAVPEDTYATINSGNGSHNLNFGPNQIEVVVKAENGQGQSYFINVTRKESSDATLSSLTVDNVSVPDFSPTKINYTITPNAPFSKTSVEIAATATDANIRGITGTGTVNLNTGDNALQVVVTAQDGTTKTYTINIERDKNSDATVKSVVVHGKTATINSEGKYEVTLDNSVSVLTPSDIAISVSADATLTKPNSNVSLNTGVNAPYVFTVTAENNHIESYEIIITRQKSNDTTIGTVTLTLPGNIEKTCTISGDACTIDVPEDTTNFTLSAEVNSTSSINPPNGSSYTMTASESTKEITLTVTAEDTTTRDYTVTVNRLKSSNNNLSELKVNGVLVDGFSPSNRTYRLTVPGLTNEVTISAVVEDTGKASIVTDLSNPFSLDFGSNNQIDIKVKAENGNTLPYTLIITREKGIDATLKDLKINGTTVTDFSPTKTGYTLDAVDYNTVALQVNATPNDTLATKTGDGNIGLKTGDNTITITVTAHDGTTTKDYYIYVNRAKNNDTGIKGITVAGISATHLNGNNYEVTVPNNVLNADSSNVIVTVNDAKLPTDAKATYAVNSTLLSTKNVNNVPITVTSEAGGSVTYNVAVTRDRSNIATLSSLTVTNGSFNPSFDPSKFAYTITVPVDTDNFDVNATKTDSESNITSGTGHYVMDSSEKDVTVSVTSEDGNVTNNYVLHIKRTKSAINTLDSITVSDTTTKEEFDLSPEFSSNEYSYAINVPGSTSSIDITAVLTDSRATIVSGTGTHSLNVGENRIPIRVMSEAGVPVDYTLAVTRAKKTDAKLIDLKVDGESVPNFHPDIFTYTIPTPYPNDTRSITIGATTSDSDATVSGIGNVGLDTGINTFNIVVTAQDGTTTETYTINVERLKNDNNYLSMLSVKGYDLKPNFDKEVENYEVTVDETKEEFGPNDVIAIAENNNAGVVKGETIPLTTNKDNYYVITVTAENGTNKLYTIKVIRPQSTDATLKDVNLTGATLQPTFSPTVKEYTLLVPYGATTFTISGVPNVPTTRVVDGDGTYNVKDQNVINLITMAEAGSAYSETYKFNIVEAPSNDATLSNLEIPGYPLDKKFESATTSYDIGNIQFNVNELMVNATPTNANSTIEILVGANKQESNQVSIPAAPGANSITINVTAPDGVSKKSYVISYTKILSDNVYLSKLDPSIGTLDIPFNKATTDYELMVDSTVDSVDFDIETEDSNASITVKGNKFSTPKKITLTDLQEGNNPLSILVTAQNNTSTKTYNVVVVKAAPVASSDATLSNLQVEGFLLDKTFDKDDKEYAIGSIPFNLENLTIKATPSISASKIRYLVNGVAQTGTGTTNTINIPKQVGNGEIVVQVTAEDNVTVLNYKIKYSKTANNNADLSGITVQDQTLKPNFDKDTLEYTIDVTEDVTSVSLTAFTADSNATISIKNIDYTSPHTTTISPLHSGANNLTITVKAEDGTTFKNYKITVNKASSGEDIPDKITSNQYGHNIDDDYILTVTPDTTGKDIKDQLDNENQYLEISSSDDQTIIGDNDKVGTGMIVRLTINGVVTDQKSIVILGDTNGDGTITPNDSVIIINHYLERRVLIGAYLAAANTNKDNDITPNDASLVQNHYLQRIDLFART